MERITSDEPQELNSIDKSFFKFAGIADVSFFIVILVFSYFLIFRSSIMIDQVLR